jgi:hypothetical protein
MLNILTVIALHVAYHETGAAVQCSREAFAAWAFGPTWEDRFIGWTDACFIAAVGEPLPYQG